MGVNNEMTENLQKDNVTPAGQIIRAVPVVFSKFGWVADLLALIIFAVSALGYLLPLWPWGAIFGVIGLLVALGGVFAAAVSVIKNLNLENSQLARINSQLTQQLADRGDLKSHRLEKFRNAIIASAQEWVGSIMSQKDNHMFSIDDFFPTLRLMAAHIIRKELNLDWIAVFEVDNSKKHETRLIFCEPDRDRQNDSCLNDIESNAIKYIVQDGSARNYWTLFLNQFNVLMMRIPLKNLNSYSNKEYILTFSSKWSDLNIYSSELVNIGEYLGRTIEFVNALVLYTKEVSKLRMQARDVEVRHYSAILYLDSDNRPQIENSSVLMKEDILRIQAILIDKQFFPLFVKAFDSTNTEKTSHTQDAYHLTLLPLVLNEQVWRVILFVIEVPDRTMSTEVSFRQGFINTIEYLYSFSSKDDKTTLFNKHYFYQHIKRIITMDKSDTVLALYVVSPFPKKMPLANDEKVMFEKISQVFKSLSNNGRPCTAAARYEGNTFLFLDKVSEDNTVNNTASTLKVLLEKIANRPMMMGVVVFPCKTKKFSNNLDKEILEIVQMGIDTQQKAKEKPNIIISDLSKVENP